METVDSIVRFIQDELAEAAIEIVPETALFDGGILDSMKLVELLTFLEQRFRITVRPSEIVLENLASPRQIAGYVERKRAN